MRPCLRCFRWLILCLIAAVAPICASAIEKQAPTFEADIRPLFAAKCFRCHGPEVQKGELALNSKERLLKGGEGGEILVPGKPEDSRLYELVLKGEMPNDKKNPFTAKETELLKRWIEGGAKFGSGGETASAITWVGFFHNMVPVILGNIAGGSVLVALVYYVIYLRVPNGK